jgi:hypothetical protein
MFAFSLLTGPQLLRVDPDSARAQTIKAGVMLELV